MANANANAVIVGGAPPNPKTPWWILPLEVLGAVMIAYLFIVVMMTASAQQNVDAALSLRNKNAAADKQIGYSTAWSFVVLAREKRTDQIAVKKVLAKDASDIAKARSDVAAAQSQLDNAWDGFAPVATRADILAACDIVLPATDDDDAHHRVWSAMTGCPKEGTLTPKQLAELTSALHASGNFDLFYTSWQTANRTLSNETIAQTADSNQEADDERQLQVWEPYQADFSDMNVLIDNWFLGGETFVPVPPSMIQILLSFFSGTFGALLITLVLVVYPQSVLSSDAATAHASRIFLGGLIALCVFIVLNGGSAILGNTSSFNQGQANYMTFAAVGILAGMFSDRVALWLSARANAFFGGASQAPANGGPGGPAPAAPPAPQPPAAQPPAAGTGG